MFSLSARKILATVVTRGLILLSKATAPKQGEIEPYFSLFPSLLNVTDMLSTVRTIDQQILVRKVLSFDVPI